MTHRVHVLTEVERTEAVLAFLQRGHTIQELWMTAPAMLLPTGLHKGEGETTEDVIERWCNESTS